MGKTNVADEATAYALAVQAGDIIAGPHVRAACKRHLDDLENAHERELTWDVESSQRILRFCRTVLKLSEGQFEGQAFDPEPSQAFILGSLFGWKRADGTRRYRRAYIEQGKGNGKALDVSTPIPTPTGWKLMGDLVDGDEVFDEHGKVCRVIQAHPVSTDRECYEVEFDDGSKIIASAEHLWKTEHRRPKPGGITLKTTKQIAETLRNANGKYQTANHSIALCGALDLPDANLSVPPYVLGAWLGDGDSDCARLTCAYEDIQVMEEIASEGQVYKEQKKHSETTGRFSLSAGRGKRGNTLSERLRALGVMQNKHIPEQYLRASRPQRADMLQGLMDTDGTISKSGQCEFTGTNKRLCNDVYELIVSLGIKASIRVGKAKLNGRVIGPKYRVLFFPPWDMPVFRLERKAARQTPVHNRRRLSADRRIVACRKVDTAPVRCITVDSPSSMFLCGHSMIPTHNSPMAGCVGIYGLVADDEAGAQIYSAGATKDQAGILFRDAVSMVNQSPALAKIITSSGGPGREFNLAYLKTQSFFRPVSRETKKTGSGPRPHFALCDELHEHPDGGVIEILERGFKFRRQPLLIMITNSGTDRQSVCWEERKHAVSVAHGDVEDDTTFSYVCALDEGDDPLTDPACWIKANPLLNVTISDEYLAGVAKQARDLPGKRNGILRLHFCVWTDSDNAWIEKELWDQVIDPTLDIADFEGKQCFVGLDLSSSRDMTGMSLVFPDGEDEDGRQKYAAFVKGYLPRASHQELVDKDGSHWEVFAENPEHLEIFDSKVVRLDEIARELVDVTARFEVEQIAYDTWLFQRFEQELDDLGIDLPIVEHPQSWKIAKDSGLCMPHSITALEALILEGRIRLHLNPVLGYAASSAVFVESPAGLRRFAKEKAGKSKIDTLVALAMGVGSATGGEAEREPEYQMFFLEDA